MCGNFINIYLTQAAHLTGHVTVKLLK